MRDHEPEIRDAGAGVAAIGTGDMDHARRFREHTGVAFPLLVDPELRTYREVGARTGGLSQALRPRVAAAGLQALARGARQHSTGRHPLVLGATHVVRPDGTVPFAWLNADFADDAPPSDVVAAVRSC